MSKTYLKRKNENSVFIYSIFILFIYYFQNTRTWVLNDMTESIFG